MWSVDELDTYSLGNGARNDYYLKAPARFCEYKSAYLESAFAGKQCIDVNGKSTIHNKKTRTESSSLSTPPATT